MPITKLWPGVYARPVSTVRVCVPPLIVKYESEVVKYLSPPLAVVVFNIKSASVIPL